MSPRSHRIAVEIIFYLCQSNFRSLVLTLMKKFTVYKASLHQVAHWIYTVRL